MSPRRAAVVATGIAGAEGDVFGAAAGRRVAIAARIASTAATPPTIHRARRRRHTGNGGKRRFEPITADS